MGNTEREITTRLNTNGNIALILNNELPHSLNVVVDNTKKESNVVEITVGTTINLPFGNIVNELMELIPLILYNTTRKLPAQMTTFIIKKGNGVESFVWMT